MKRLLRWIGSSGTLPEYPARLNKQIRVSNYIAAGFVAISLPNFILLVIATSSLGLAGLLGTALLGYASPIFLNRMGAHRWGRTMPLVTGSLVIFTVVRVLGPETNVQLCLSLLSILPFVVFDVSDRWIIGSLEVLPAGLYIAATFLGPHFAPMLALSPHALASFRLMATLSAILPAQAILAFFYFDNRKNEDALITSVSLLEVEIEERKHSETELIQANELAEAGARTKSEFLATISHEVRTPINAVIGMVGLLRDTHLTSEQCQMLDTIEASGQNLVSIISDILDISRIDAGRLHLERAPYSPTRVVHDVATAFSIQAKTKGLAVNVAISPHMPVVAWGDAARIRQVLTNLWGNAIKFTSKGTISVSADFAWSGPSYGELSISIRDTGIGISSHVRERIFEVFTQSDSSRTRSHEGAGLGLSISHRLMTQMGGKISVESEEGKGSHFQIRISLAAQPAPVEADKEEDAGVSEIAGGTHGGEHPSSAQPTSTPAPALPRTTSKRAVPSGDLIPIRVLVAEDNSVNQTIVRAALKKMGATCVIAENGQKAVECFVGGSFDLILMDIQMPVMDGYEATHAIRGLDGAGKYIPIVALTANASPEYEAKAFESGMNGFLAKPIRVEALRDAVRKFVKANADHVAA